MPQYIILNLSFVLVIQVTNCHPKLFFQSSLLLLAVFRSRNLLHLEKSCPLQVEVPRPIVVEKCIEVPKIQVGWSRLKLVDVWICIQLESLFEVQKQFCFFCKFLPFLPWFVLQMGCRVESGLWWKVEERTVRVPKIVNTVGSPRVR